MQSIALFQVKRLACIRKEHPLTGRITLRELAAYPFVCPHEDVGLLLGFRQIFSKIDLELPEVLVSNSFHISKEIVLNSDAFALFSDLSVLNERRLELIRTVELGLPQDWIQLILREEQTPTDLMKAFVADIIAACEHLTLDVHTDAIRFQKAHGRTPITK